MNYYVLLINITLMCAIYFSTTSLLHIIIYMKNKTINAKDHLMYSNIKLIFGVILIALYNYLIMTQI